MHMKSKQRFTDSLAKMKLPALDLGSSEKSIPADATSEVDSSGRRLERGGQRASGEAVFPATAHGGRRRPISSRDGLGGRERSVRVRGNRTRWTEGSRGRAERVRNGCGLVSRASGSRGHAYREPASNRQAAAMREGAHGSAHAHVAHSIFLPEGGWVSKLPETYLNLIFYFQPSQLITIK
jgi:hypothetical protein